MVMTKAGSTQPATEVREDATPVDSAEVVALNDVASEGSAVGVMNDALSLVDSVTGIQQSTGAGQGNVVTPRSK